MACDRTRLKYKSHKVRLCSSYVTPQIGHDGNLSYVTPQIGHEGNSSYVTPQISHEGIDRLTSDWLVEAACNLSGKDQAYSRSGSNLEYKMFVDLCFYYDLN